MSSPKKVINPKYFSGYTYELDMEDNAVVVVKVNVPKNLKQDDISVKYNSEKCIVYVAIGDEIPFISGVCYEKVKNFKYTFVPGLVTLTFTKEDPSITWPFLIKSAISKKKNLDPASALMLAVQNFMMGNIQGGQILLAYSAECMYPPAIVQYANFLIQNGVSCDPLIPNLFKCVDEYNYGEAGAMLGNLSLIGQISFDTAFPYIKKSATQFNDPSAKFLYACYLSPLEKPHGRFEDGEEAYKVLQEIEKENAFARFGLARLVREGIGCEKDEAKANELLESARRENPQVPTFEETDAAEKEELNPTPKKIQKLKVNETPQANTKKETPKAQTQNQKESNSGILSKIAVVGTVCLFAAAAGYTVYQNFVRRK